MASPFSLSIYVTAQADPVLNAIRAYEAECMYAVAGAQRAAAAATAKDSRAEIARRLELPKGALQKQLRPYSRRRPEGGWLAKCWLGYKSRLWPRQHEAIAAAAVRAGFKRAFIKGTLEYIRRDHKGPGSIEFFNIDLDTDTNRAIVAKHGAYHANVTYRIRLAREVDRRLARLGGGRRFRRGEVGFYEARLTRLLNSEIRE